jgi:uncharacterized protein (TIGR03435 family)
MRDHAELRKLIVATAGAVALAVPTAVGALMVPRLQAKAQAGRGDRPAFEVASIKANKSGGPMAGPTNRPGGLFISTNRPLGVLIDVAYNLRRHQRVGGPDWIDAERFDIEARAEGNPSYEQMWPMLQSLLADRFKLIVHHETRQLPIYALELSTPGKPGPQLTPHTDDSTCFDVSSGRPPAPAPGEKLPLPCGHYSFSISRGTSQMSGSKITMDNLAGTLSANVDRIVVDRTGLNGTFDLTLQFATQIDVQPGPEPDPSASPALPTALRDQLGLKLESTTGPVDVLVIDHVEEPSPN